MLEAQEQFDSMADMDKTGDTGHNDFVPRINNLGLESLFEDNKILQSDVKSEKISKNCKRFNRLFHAEGEDSSSLDESVPVTMTRIMPIPSLSSSRNKYAGIEIATGKSEACSSNNALKSQKGMGEQEIVLEIEIQADEDDDETVSSSPIFLKTEEDSTSESADEFDTNISTSSSQILQPHSEGSHKFPPLSIWNTNFFGSIMKNENKTASPLIGRHDDEDEIQVQVDDDEDDEDEQQEGTKTKKTTLKVKREKNQDFSIGERKSSRLGPKTSFCNKEHEAQVIKRVKAILKKDLDDLTLEDQQLMEGFPVLVGVVKKRLETRLVASERLKEFEDSSEILEEKCNQLAEVLRKAHYVVIYTGAGISTSAQIPDYRGPNGIWTLLKNGQSLDSQNPVVLTTADPTVTHMTIKQLYQRGVAKHIVSQNCDGLHLRSGIPKNALSEVHGNMYIEVCLKCGREYVRLFDVTENTRRHEHRTGRCCYHCGNELKDTVVHFGERGSLRWPLNWAGAEYNVNKADVILCLGSSLKVLRRYPWLWGMDKPACKRPKLFIVNLQWTPKDAYSALKIHGKCDEVMSKVMQRLNISIPSYKRETDPIFSIATPLHSSELRSKSSRELTFPENLSFPEKHNDINNYIRFDPVFHVSSPSEIEASKSSSTDSTKKKIGKKREILKGNGNGWLGNAWGVKPKKKKLK